MLRLSFIIVPMLLASCAVPEKDDSILYYTYTNGINQAIIHIHQKEFEGLPWDLKEGLIEEGNGTIHYAIYGERLDIPIRSRLFEIKEVKYFPRLINMFLEEDRLVHYEVKIVIQYLNEA